jgi:hypothetical protein
VGWGPLKFWLKLHNIVEKDILEFRIEFGDYRPSADGDIQQIEHGGFLSVAKKDGCRAFLEWTTRKYFLVVLLF